MRWGYRRHIRYVIRRRRFRLLLGGSDYVPGSGGDLYVNSLVELDSFFEAQDPAIPSSAWDDIWPILGYATAAAADDAMYSTGISKSAILSAYASLP